VSSSVGYGFATWGDFHGPEAHRLGPLAPDRYTASYIGRPGTIHERDYDCGFPSEDEPDEHEQWRPVRVDGTEFSGPPKAGSEALPAENAQFLKSYPPIRAHTLSCFNAAAALAVIINRVSWPGSLEKKQE
jgi:hypothetical protein